MFRFLHSDDKSTVVNERGIIIRSVGRKTKEYIRGDKKAWFYKELDDVNSPKIFIHIQKNHSWEKPHESEVITTSEMEIIKNDFQEAYKILIPDSKGIEFVEE